MPGDTRLRYPARELTGDMRAFWLHELDKAVRAGDDRVVQVTLKSLESHYGASVADDLADAAGVKRT